MAALTGGHLLTAPGSGAAGILAGQPEAGSGPVAPKSLLPIHLDLEKTDRELIAHVLAALGEVLGEEFVGAYLHGSAVLVGGLERRATSTCSRCRPGRPPVTRNGASLLVSWPSREATRLLRLRAPWS